MTQTQTYSVIQVSGYPAMEAKTMLMNGCLVRYAGDIQAQTWEDFRERGHCGYCNATLVGANALDQRLGSTACVVCATRLLTHCVNTYRRVPDPQTEFYCVGSAWPGTLGGAHIAALTDRCPPDADGRRRWRCKPCRLLQWQRANENRKEKRKNGWGYGGH